MSKAPVPQEPPDHVALMAELGMMTRELLHELRQPVFAIAASAEMALSEGGPADRWATVRDQAAALLELIERYGTLGTRDEAPRLHDVRTPIVAAVEMLAHRATRIGVTVRASLWHAPVWSLVGEGIVRQIALNLVANALDAAGEVAGGEVRVRLEVAGSDVVLLVDDNGVGMPPEVMDRAFEPFVTSKAARGGSGLGLFVTRRLVTSEGGCIQLVSGQGGGTTARVTLPLAPTKAGG